MNNKYNQDVQALGDEINDYALDQVTVPMKPGDPAGPASGGNKVPNRIGTISASKTGQYTASHRNISNLIAGQPRIKPKGRQTPTKGGKSSQINLNRSVDEIPATVSYNTKVFNREIEALRNEEEALLKF